MQHTCGRVAVVTIVLLTSLTRCSADKGTGLTCRNRLLSLWSAAMHKPERLRKSWPTIVVRVVNVQGNGLSGVTVNWTVSSGGDHFRQELLPPMRAATPQSSGRLEPHPDSMPHQRQ